MFYGRLFLGLIFNHGGHGGFRRGHWLESATDGEVHFGERFSDEVILLLQKLDSRFMPLGGVHFYQCFGKAV
ncbi:hypothetical protein J2X69_002464 [Algoriphagus sp. 4150]|nr:hypothetical protein [Algoriphagus sp. 4150]